MFGLHFKLAEPSSAGHFHLHFGFPPATLTAVVSAVAPYAVGTGAITLGQAAVITAVAPPAVGTGAITLGQLAVITAVAPQAVGTGAITLGITATATCVAPLAIGSGRATLWGYSIRRDGTCSYSTDQFIRASAYQGRWDSLRPITAVRSLPWSAWIPRQAIGRGINSPVLPKSRIQVTAWDQTSVMRQSDTAGWAVTRLEQAQGDNPWGIAGSRYQAGGNQYTLGLVLDHHGAGPWSVGAAQVRRGENYWIGVRLVRQMTIRWRPAGWLWWRGRLLPLPIPNPLPIHPPTGPFHLFFHRPGWPVPDGCDFRLHFGKKYYTTRYGIYMITDLNLYRLPGLEPIRFQTLSIEASMDSHSRLLRATLKDAASNALVQIGTDLVPVEVRAVLNGYSFDFVVTDCLGGPSFADATWTLNAQSPLIYLGAPYAPARDYLETNERTAEQLAIQELTGTDFELEWDTQNWPVPASTWSYQNLTPLEAVKQIAAAVKAYVSDDMTTHEVFVRPQYPISPWLWPIQIPVTTITASQAKSCTLQNLRYDDSNRIVVSGGAIGKVRVVAVRNGTAGDRSRSTNTENLICHIDAGTERARQELSAAGHHVDVVLDGIPLTAAPDPPGLLQIGTLIEVAWRNETPWIGMITGTKIDASIGSLLQTVTIDRYLG